MTLAQTVLRAFLAEAETRLRGEWVLLGASVLCFLGIARPTADIDLAKLEGFSKKDQFALMDAALAIGLAPETVNSAAGYFLSKIPDFKSELVELSRRSGFTLYRPNATLFLKLKAARMTETDLQDCLALIQHGSKMGEKLDLDSLALWIAEKRAGVASDAVVARLDALSSALAGLTRAADLAKFHAKRRHKA